MLMRADSNAQVGTGHVMRCLALAQAWQDGGGEALFLMAPGAPAVAERIRSEGMKVQTLLSASGTSGDAAELTALSRKVSATWVVLDGRHFPSEYHKHIKQADLRLACIDDQALLHSYYSEVIVNPNPRAEELKYPCLPGTRLLLGTKYALLRREFSTRTDIRRPLSERGRNVLVTMGGADPDNITGKVLKALAQLPLSEVLLTVVIGPNNPHESALRNIMACLQAPIILHKDVANMPDLIGKADLCITAGGGTCWELAFMGVPMLLITIAENHVSTVDTLAKEGCAISLGWFHALTAQTIASSVRNLLQDRGHRQRLVKTGRRLVDGQGAARIVRSLKPL